MFMPVEFPVPPTEYQKELEAEVAKAFCARLYNNVIYNRSVYTGAKGEKRGFSKGDKK
jgi:hypothetical protein